MSSAHYRQKGMGVLAKSPPDHRDWVYGAPAAVQAALPDSRDLTDDYAPRIFDQLELGSCTANATNRMVQFVERTAKDPDYDRLSRLWTYYYTRLKEGTQDSDAGGLIRDAVAVTAERGVPREALWPYDIDKFDQEPTAGQRSAPHHRTLGYFAIPEGDERSMQACIAEGFPFVFGFAVYESFFDAVVEDSGVWSGTRGFIEGYHAVCCMGYDFRPGAYGFASGGWKIPNSWGKHWGDDGYFYVPRGFLGLEAFDLWTIRRVSRDTETA